MKIPHDRGFLKLILDSMNEGVAVVDKNFKIIHFNEAAEKITGYKLEDTRDKFCKYIFKTENCFSNCPLALSLEQKKNLKNFTLQIQPKDGSKKTIRLNTGIIYDEGKSPVGRFLTSPIIVLLAFVFLFVLFMTFGEKKQDRYILPVYPVLGIVAAIGLVQIFKLRSFISGSLSLLFLVILLFQGALVVLNYPYYLTYYNPLLGGIRVAERVLTLCRLFNLAAGLGPEQDRLPERFFEPTVDGALQDRTLDHDEMEAARLYYYHLMGWDERGVPKSQKLIELGIEEFARSDYPA